VKTNFDNAQAASGTLSLVKTVLALQHGVVPPESVTSTACPDELNLIDTQMVRAQTTTPWSTTATTRDRAAVSSYGLSGTNVHMILEEAPQQALPDTGNGSAFTAPLLFALSSTSEQELRRTAGRLADWATAHADDVALPDLPIPWPAGVSSSGARG